MVTNGHVTRKKACKVAIHNTKGPLARVYLEDAVSFVEGPLGQYEGELSKDSLVEPGFTQVTPHVRGCVLQVKPEMGNPG